MITFNAFCQAALSSFYAKTLTQHEIFRGFCFGKTVLLPRVLEGRQAAFFLPSPWIRAERFFESIIGFGFWQRKELNWQPWTGKTFAFCQMLPIQMSKVIITVFSWGDSNDVLMMPPQRGRQLIFPRADPEQSIRSFMPDARFIN